MVAPYPPLIFWRGSLIPSSRRLAEWILVNHHPLWVCWDDLDYPASLVLVLYTIGATGVPGVTVDIVPGLGATAELAFAGNVLPFVPCHSSLVIVACADSPFSE